jgi:1-acyl-sn-glycerol-3-phosphate acyltransferase
MTVTLRFLAPFDPADCADRKVIAAMARERIAASMAKHQHPSACAPPPV